MPLPCNTFLSSWSWRLSWREACLKRYVAPGAQSLASGNTAMHPRSAKLETGPRQPLLRLVRRHVPPHVLGDRQADMPGTEPRLPEFLHSAITQDSHQLLTRLAAPWTGTIGRAHRFCPLRAVSAESTDAVGALPPAPLPPTLSPPFYRKS